MKYTVMTMENRDYMSTDSVSEAFIKRADRSKEIMDSVRKEHKEMLGSNALYRKYTFSGLILALLIIALVVYVFGKRVLEYGSLKEAFSYQRFDDIYFTKDTTLIYHAVLILILFVNIVTIIRWIYSKRIERSIRKLKSCEKQISKRITSDSSAALLDSVRNAIEEGNRDFSVTQKNDIGDRIIKLRERFKAWNRRAKSISAVVSPLLSAVYYLFGFVLTWLLRDSLEEFRQQSVFILVLFGAYTYFAIDVAVCKSGGHMGKLMRPFGCLLALVYAGYVYWLTGGSWDFPAFIKEYGGHEVILSPLKGIHVIILLQLIAMITGVLSADYLGMKRKWNDGYETVMKYGNTKFKSRFSVIFRGAVAAFWIMTAWYIGVNNHTMSILASLPFVWWVSMPLFKPFGSSLYAFFGRMKCVSISMMSFSLMVFFYYGENGALDIEILIRWGLCLILYAVLGAVVYVLNEGTEAFALMRLFV